MTTIEAISSFKGKTILNVLAKIKDDNVNTFTIYFEDGSEFEVFPSITHNGNEVWPASAEIVVEKV